MFGMAAVLSRPPWSWAHSEDRDGKTMCPARTLFPQPEAESWLCSSVCENYGADWQVLFVQGVWRKVARVVTEAL